MAKFLYWRAGSVVGNGGSTAVFDAAVFDPGVFDDASGTSPPPPPVPAVYEAGVYAADVYDDGAGGTPSALLGLGASTLLTSSPSAVTTSWLASAGSGFAPVTGDAVVRLLALDNGTNVWPVTVTIGGSAVLFRVGQDAGHGGASRGVMAWIGTVRGLPAGSALDVVLTTSGATTGATRIMLRVSDLSGWTGNAGGSGSALVVSGSATGVSTSATLARTGGLLVGVAGVNNANLGVPPGLSASGWTKETEGSVGTTVGNSSDAVWVTATGGVAGTTKALAVAGAGTASDWAAAMLELY